MANYKEITMRYLDSEGVHYTDAGEFHLKITYKGDNMKSVPVNVWFDDDGDPLVSCNCWEIASFKGKEELAYKACNEANDKYRWAKFYMDKDSDIVCSSDSYVTPENAGATILFKVKRLASVCDSAYPIFMKALWS